MPGFREQKRKAREALHKGLSDFVLYIPERFAEPQAISIRLHTAFSQEGGLSDAWAERHEITPKIRFLGTTPKKLGIVVTEDMGAFVIDSTLPPHDITTDAVVSKLTATQALKEDLDVNLPWCGLPAPKRPA